MIRWTKICTSLQFLSHVYGFEISFLLVFFYSFCYISLLLLLLHYFLPCITKRDGNSSSTIFFIEERPRDEKKKRKWLDLTSTPFLLSFPSTLFFFHKQLLDSVLLSLSLSLSSSRDIIKEMAEEGNEGPFVTLLHNLLLYSLNFSFLYQTQSSLSYILWCNSFKVSPTESGHKISNRVPKVYSSLLVFSLQEK